MPSPASASFPILPEVIETDRDSLLADAVNRLADHLIAAHVVSAIAEAKGADRITEVINAISYGATLGQAYTALKQGTQPSIELAPLTPSPYAEPFEQLRDASDAHAALTGRRPLVFMANMGPMAHFNARAGYSRNFFEAGGFEIIADSNGHQGESRDDHEGAADKAVQAFSDSGANIAVICSSDKIYPDIVPVLVPKLKAAGAQTVILAGFPGDQKEAYDAAGVDQYIYIKCDVLGTLTSLLEQEGVL